MKYKGEEMNYANKKTNFKNFLISTAFIFSIIISSAKVLAMSDDEPERHVIKKRNKSWNCANGMCRNYENPFFNVCIGGCCCGCGVVALPIVPLSLMFFMNSATLFCRAADSELDWFECPSHD